VKPDTAPLLAFDTSGPHLAAALVQGGGLRLARMVPMATGQAEALMPFLEGILAEAGLTWSDLTALAVGVGPGNFTGVRIAVSAARGLALGLGIPVHGLSTFELMRDPASLNAHADEWVSLPAPRAMVHLQRFAHGQPVGAPRLVDPDRLPGDPGAGLPSALRVRGHDAAQIAAAMDAQADPADLADLPQRLAAVALWKQARGLPDAPPRPVYVRPPDAAPPSEAPPVLIG